MGQCSICKKKILYNKYKMYRGKVLCSECYSTRLKRKAAKRAERKRQAELTKIVTPTKKAKKKAKKAKLNLTISSDVAQDEKESTEDSS